MPQILEVDKAILRVHAGEATFYDGEKIDLAYSTNGTPVISFDDGTTVYWTWEELLDEAMRLKREEEKKL